jgi:hypothetical protein
MKSHQNYKQFARNVKVLIVDAAKERVMHN